MPWLSRRCTTSAPLRSQKLWVAGLTPCRNFSFLNDLSNRVAAGVSKLTEDGWLAEEKLVTEPRRRVELQRSSEASLGERLAQQRKLRSCLIPTSITVDPSKQYVSMTWPAAALQAIEEQRTGRLASGAPASSLPLHFVTRGLAEYLRAYTPSTDGSLGNQSITIYGRRGITITDIIPIGSYALRLVFSDGHSGGIYSYEYLYHLTGPEHKYRLMRQYVNELQVRRKSRNPPRRVPSRKYQQRTPVVVRDETEKVR